MHLTYKALRIQIWIQEEAKAEQENLLLEGSYIKIKNLREANVK